MQDGMTPLMLACKFGQDEIIEGLIEKGAEINDKNTKVRSIFDAKYLVFVRLMHVIIPDHFELLQSVHASMDDNMFLQEGKLTPLHYAITADEVTDEERTLIVRCLLRHKADPNARSSVSFQFVCQLLTMNICSISDGMEIHDCSINQSQLLSQRSPLMPVYNVNK
jgi:ankyrin repeat protein